MSGDAVGQIRDARRRGRGLRVLTVLLAVLGAASLLMAASALHALSPRNVDPVLAGLPGAGGAGDTTFLGVVVLGLAGLAALLAGRWLATARNALEALLGIRLDARRPGPPARFSRRRWQPLVAPAAPDREGWWATGRARDGRRSAAVTLAAVTVGLVLLPTGLLVGTLALGGPAATTALWLQLVGAVLLGLGAALAVPVLVAVRRREVVALRNVAPELPPLPRPLPLPLVAAGVPAVFVLLAALTVPASETTCEVDGALCVDLVVPADRDNPASGETMTVRYAVTDASRPDARLLVVAVGGPGASGIEELPWRLDSFGPQVRNAFDIVFFDQRGVGASGGRDCPDAAAAWHDVPPSDWQAARDFVADCLDEARVEPKHLPRYRTEQVVGDIDAIRRHLGYERVTIYGESYGTELAQAYAVAHPDRVDALVLDGPVDLADSPHAFWLAAARGFGSALALTFEDCRADPACRLDLPDPEETYREVLDQLNARPASVAYWDGVDRVVTEVTGPGFEAAVGGAMYTPTGRSVVLRALAEAERDEWDYVARFAGGTAGVWDLGGISTFAYYAVSCGDEPFTARAGDGSEHTTGAERAASEWTARAEAAGVDEILLGSTYYAALPCVHWPAEPDPGIPGLENAPFPVLVLAATADPITPPEGGRAIVARQPEAWLVETTGGAHVSFGWGDPCVDDVVIGFLVQGERPEGSVTCEGHVTDGHWAVTPLDAEDLGDPLDAATSFEAELLTAPEFYWWDGAEDLEFGCRFGGSARMDYDGSQLRVTLSDCEWSRGLALDATGRIDPESLDVRLDFAGEETDARYVSTADEWSLEGTWQGEEVSIEG